jgi:pSer/pThr/pTyr-binding forkhead associated (FHA) protein
MQQDSPETEEAVTVHLIDPARGNALQMWCFAGKSVISVGRADDRDVVLMHPYISRNHAELRFQQGQWWLVALGRNGVQVQGQGIEDTLAYDGMQFRLGANGPTLRFRDSMSANSNEATLNADSCAAIVLRIDETRLSAEVDEIADGEYFRDLQQRARELRRRRHANPA